MHLVRAALTPFDESLPTIAVRADRHKLARRLWRAAADDGTEFGFEVETPLADGDVVWTTARARYVVRQAPEPVLEIPLPETPEAAAAAGWAIGNLHFPVEARAGRLLAPDDPGLRAALDRLGLPHRPANEVFRPQGPAGHLHDHSHEHGHSHRH